MYYIACCPSCGLAFENGDKVAKADYGLRNSTWLFHVSCLTETEQVHSIGTYKA